MIEWIKNLFKPKPIQLEIGYRYDVSPEVVNHKEELTDLAIEHRREWIKDGLALIQGLPLEASLTGEEIKEILLENGLDSPHHQNVWGALIRIAVARGYIEPTGDVRPMKAPQSHGRRTPVYKVL